MARVSNLAYLFSFIRALFVWIINQLLLLAYEARPKSARKEAFRFDDEANLLWTFCRRGGPGEDQADHWPDAEVR